MSRRIRIQAGDIVSYYGAHYEAVSVFSYIVYLKELRKDDKERKVICVGMGDLVMGGAYIENTKYPEVFTYSPRPQPQPQTTPRPAAAYA